MKRCTIVLLGILVLHSTGLRVICMPAAPSEHDCCPSEESTPAKPDALPECCLVTTVRYHGSVARTSPKPVNAVQTLEPAPNATPVAVPTSAQHPRLTRAALPAPSPPVSPLQQTCLLLI